MSQFRFRLQALLDARFRKEDELKRHLGELEGGITREKKALAQLQRGLEEVSIGGDDLEACAVDVEKAKMLRGYYARLCEQIDDQRQVIARLLEEADVQRTRVVEAMRERKIVENLRTRHLEQFSQEESRKEQAMLDDLATSKYVCDQLTDGPETT